MSATGKPLTPAEIREHASPIPGIVFDVFNAFIARGAGIRAVTVTQEEVVRMLTQHGFTSREIFDRHLLDVEPAYEAAGWKVVYDKPGHNETYEPTWTFTPKRSTP